MRRHLLELLACPTCRRPLDCRAAAVTDAEIQEGELACTACGAVFPITRGIPRFVPSENYASSFGYQWNRFRQEQIDSLNGTRQSERRLRTETGWDPDWLQGKWILDAGCGAGRFLEVASRSGDCEIVGVDLSAAVDATQATLSGRRNVHLIQASIFALPFRPHSFDGVYCIGVIQHTPDPARALRCLAMTVRTGGRLAVTMYERRRFTMLCGKYWARPLARQLRQEWLLRLIKLVMPLAFVLSEVLFRIPRLGRAFQFIIPVANYVDDPELSVRQRYRWAVLDTFDMLAPTFDMPQRESDVVDVLRGEGIEDLRRLPNPGLNIVGTKARAGT